jgi:triacylglycerol lipase
MKRLIYLFIILVLNNSCNQQANNKKAEIRNSVSLSDSANEKTACLFSEISYCTHTDSVLKAFMPGWELAWDGGELGGNKAFLATNGSIYFLSIRGSLISFSWDAFQNWIYEDLNVASQEKWPFTSDGSSARIAEGAYTGWQNLCNMKDKKTGETLLQFIEKNLRGLPLVITGHSLGGNLATVYASYLYDTLSRQTKSRPLINVISFAAPAAGDPVFAADFDKKFPASVRVENIHDIVPKFPTTSGIGSLAGLFNDSLSATKIQAGYKGLSLSLSKVFGMIRTALRLLEFTGIINPYLQPNGAGKLLSVPVSGQNNGNTVIDWLKEAGYQHGMERYASMEGVTVIHCLN